MEGIAMAGRGLVAMLMELSSSEDYYQVQILPDGRLTLWHVQRLDDYGAELREKVMENTTEEVIIAYLAKIKEEKK